MLKFVHMVHKTRENERKDKKRYQLDNQGAKEYLGAKTVLIGYNGSTLVRTWDPSFSPAVVVAATETDPPVAWK